MIFLTPTIVRGDSTQTTGYEKFTKGLPNKEVYANDKLDAEGQRETASALRCVLYPDKQSRARAEFRTE